MDCTEAHSRLIRYADNDLSGSARLEIEEHLEHCYLCQEEFDEIVAITDMCHETLRHPRPRDRFAELRPYLKTVSAPPRHPGSFLKKLTTGLAVAAGLLMFLSVAEPIMTAARQFMAFKLDASIDQDLAPLTAENVPFPGVFSYRKEIVSWERFSKPSREVGDAEKDASALNDSRNDAAPDKTDKPVSFHVRKAKRALA